MIALPFDTRQPDALRQRRSGQGLADGIVSCVGHVLESPQ